MAEDSIQADVQDDVVDQQLDEGQEGQQTGYSADETLAMDNGWKPKDQYKGDLSKWVPADEFNRRGELFNKIEFQNKELKEMRKALKEIVDHQSSVREQAYQEAIRTLKEQKAQAVEEGDSKAFLKVEQQEEQLKETWSKEKAVAKEQTKRGPSEVFTGFLLDNPWYSKDTEQREFADKIGISYAQRLGIQPGTASPEQEAAVLEYVTTKVREKFNVSKKTSAVEAGRGSATGTTSQQSKGVKEADLSSTEKRAMENFVRWGVMSKAEYLKSLDTASGSRR